ncbi:dihydropyrimidinase [Clostridium sp. AM58-1XD]|uniref:dihydropyrimidinase n=1 Tax=Clostridium sp. AM58-1XD TaxID=2292307 RepID=UPI000E49829E|nr:dihydropyrimidinase [Clostridium sp. AM58-1XD]RGY97695.1 dihydropyrimidinase [Clostridium sp. AM58-1XD]
MSLIIKNGMIVTASDVFKADMKISGGLIEEISCSMVQGENDEIIDAEGQYVLAGGIDPHVHFGVPGYADDFRDGTRAAAAGGITTILNFVEPPLPGRTLMENFSMWKDMAKDSYIDYGLQPIINEEHSEEALSLMPELLKEGVSTVKLFMSARGIGLMVSDANLYRILSELSKNHMLATVHCENGDIIDQIVKETVEKGNTSTLYHGLSRPEAMEAEATNRILSIAQVTGANIRVAHVSCKQAMDVIEAAQERGVHAYGETCAHYLTKDITDLDKDFAYSSRFICSPPLREKWNQDALWKGIKKGILSTMGSDHAPVPYKDGKTKGMDNFSKIPNGGPGVEDMFSIMYHYGVHEGRITLPEFTRILSFNTAKLMGIYPQKGVLQVGADADIVILDPNQTRTITVDKQYQKCDYNAYEGTTVYGVITHVLSRGEEIVRDGIFQAEEQIGRGHYLYRKPIAE